MQTGRMDIFITDGEVFLSTAQTQLLCLLNSILEKQICRNCVTLFKVKRMGNYRNSQISIQPAVYCQV